ncbi:DUF5343 domain-containing protein [Microbacterium sp. NPDC076895]|uniref:DUF5343 domain-containing protein n=1 Tax=Microbacterium sp. NPDC076895 TaxID=3154957 RepID=UPI003444FF33
MATSFPYASGGSLAKAIAQFRQSFPPVVNASTLKKFAIAPNNESYVIAVLRFLGFIDEEGNRRDDNIGYFYGTDDGFQQGLETTLRSAYKPIFDDFGEAALDKTRDELLPWFRATDKSSQTVGSRQAATFTALAALAGHGDPPAIPNGPSASGNGGGTKAKPKPNSAAKPAAKSTHSVEAGEAKPPALSNVGGGSGGGADVGLTVRIEVNLPAGGDESTYDAIFKSIRKNLIDGRS